MEDKVTIFIVVTVVIIVLILGITIPLILKKEKRDVVKAGIKNKT